MKRHAYLIKAHHQFDLLEKLLRLLDDERNDIYIHIGVGVNYDRARFEKCVKRSGIFFVYPVKESWGGYSQIESELHLFEAAAENSYAYYHLLSGVDLPLKTQDEIHAFLMQMMEKSSFISVRSLFGRSLLTNMSSTAFGRKRLEENRREFISLWKRFPYFCNADSESGDINQKWNIAWGLIG